MKSKRSLKGFTLVELIIVMALFSLVMFSVAQLLSPVSKFYVRTSNFESSTACIDNMKRAIEGNLKYADRVRVYCNYNPSTDLQTHVNDFWVEFFGPDPTKSNKRREFLDCKGTIYAMTFDNSVPGLTYDGTNWVIDGYSNLEDFAHAQVNSGKISLYQYTFDNTATPTLLSIDDWYVNQKMYGNYEYQFILSSSDPTHSSPVDVFDPADCQIQIKAYEVKRDHTDGNNRLIVDSTPQVNDAAFAMKNVLDPEHHYTTALMDHKLILDVASATYSVTGDKRYRLDTYGIPRYDTLRKNSYNPSNFATISYGGQDLSHTAAGIPGFYFVFTLPDSVQDEEDTDYMDAVEAVFTT